MVRISRYGMNDDVAWNEHKRKQRSEATKAYREKNKFKYVLCTEDFHRVLKSGKLGESIKESQDNICRMIYDIYPELRKGDK